VNDKDPKQAPIEYVFADVPSGVAAPANTGDRRKPALLDAEHGRQGLWLLFMSSLTGEQREEVKSLSKEGQAAALDRWAETALPAFEDSLKGSRQ